MFWAPIPKRKRFPHVAVCHRLRADFRHAFLACSPKHCLTLKSKKRSVVFWKRVFRNARFRFQNARIYRSKFPRETGFARWERDSFGTHSPRTPYDFWRPLKALLGILAVLTLVPSRGRKPRTHVQHPDRTCALNCWPPRTPQNKHHSRVTKKWLSWSPQK